MNTLRKREEHGKQERRDQIEGNTGTQDKAVPSCSHYGKFPVRSVSQSLAANDTVLGGTVLGIQVHSIFWASLKANAMSATIERAALKKHFELYTKKYGYTICKFKRNF